jgi:hypothetical protein
MAKKSSAAKKLKGEVKKFIDEYKDKLLLLAVGFFESKAKYIVDWVKDLGHLKRKIRALVICFGLMIAGLLLVVFGVADYVVYKFPALANGLGYVLVGVIAIVVGYLIKKLS